MWSSFLGVDLFKANPWIEAYGYQPIDFALPNLCGVPYGDCPRPNSTFSALQCPILASRYDNPYIRWIACTYTVGKQTMPIFTRNIDTTGHWAEYDLSSRPLRDPKDGLPRERFYRGWGAVSMRSDWTENGTFAMFRIGDVVSNHNHADSGMFFIYRNGVLASDRGTFTGDFRAGNHYKNFSPLAIAHNVVTVRDPADKFVPNDGGQRAVAAQMGLYGQPGTVAEMVWERPEEIKPELVISRQAGGGYAARRYWETGDMLAYDPAEEYVYAAGDVTAAYQNSLSEWGSAESAPRSRTKRLKVMTRAFLYIRPDYFAVFDRVDALKPEFEKKWLLQMALEPKIDGDTVVVERNDLIKSRYALRIGRMKTPTESPAWHEYQNHGKMFCKTLLPREFKIEKVGGPGKEFWVDGKNYDDLGEGNKANPAPCPGDVGSWRVEVSPKEGRTLDCFLHVMQVGDSKGLEKMVPVEYIEKDGMVGFTMAANGGTYTVLFNQETGIGGHITFEKDGKRAIDRDFAMTLGENRKPQSAGAGGAKP
jgi:hypothetical protein